MIFLACAKRGCKLSMDYEILHARRRFTHNGGEAVLFIDDFTIATDTPPRGLTREQLIAWRNTYIARRVREWVDEVHAYDDRCRPPEVD